MQFDAQHFKAFYNRAFCLDKLGKHEEAEKDYVEAVRL